MADIRVLPAAAWPMVVARELAGKINTHPELRICLPTGETPAPLYAELARAAGLGEVTLAQVTLVLLDEYVGLNPRDPARCDAQIQSDLIERLPERPRAFHSIRVDELAPAEAAAAHDAVAAEGLDLALVGLGRNGHVGFNEPGSTADSPTRVVELTPESVDASAEYGAQHRPTHGVTLGLSRLLEAGEIWMLVTGAHKAAILRAALEEPETPTVPASHLRRHPRLLVYADQQAAANLG